jgi:hypothetical protein
VASGPVVFLARKDLDGRTGTEVRLKDLLNVELPSEVPGPGGTLRARFTSRENKRVPRLQWVGAEGSVAVDILGIEGDHTSGLGEAALGAAQPGDIFQFERVGFVRVERDWVPGAAPLRVVYGHP